MEEKMLMEIWLIMQVVFIVLFCIIILSFFIKFAVPELDKVIVISGRKRRYVTNEIAIYIHPLEREDFLYAGVVTVPYGSFSKTADLIKLNIWGGVKAQIERTESACDKAFLLYSNKDELDLPMLLDLAIDSVVSDITKEFSLEEIRTDREAFNQKIFKKVEHHFETLGFKVISHSIHLITMLTEDGMVSLQKI